MADGHITGNATEDIHATRFPGRQLVPRGRQRPQPRPIELLEERAAAHAHALHRPGIDGLEARADCGVQVPEREERLVPQHREDPPLGDLHTDFDLRFVFRMRRAGRQNDGAVVVGQLGIRPVDLRLVVIRRGHTALQ
ncbi:MAG: hypothetical protein NUW01_11655, partial [Gemmatimonadaceae bacterium]|nr:hypothetical protein [Gemmatimonadaceae bacterium]